MVRNSFEKCVEMPFIRVISSYTNITHNDKCVLYNSAAMIWRQQRKDIKTGLGLSNSNRRSEYAKAIEEIQNLAPQKLFQIYQLKTYQQFIEMPAKNFNSILHCYILLKIGKAVGNQFQQRLRLYYFINATQ